MDELTELMTQFVAATKSRVVDLRFIDGHWCMMYSRVTCMSAIGETIASTPTECVRLALEKWDKRSPENPF